MKLFLRMRAFSVLFLTLFFLSCNFPKYYFKDDYIKTGVNFSEGKWLLDKVHVSKNQEVKITKMAKEFFEKKLNNRFTTIFEEKLLIAQNNNFPLTTEQLKQIKIGTNFDYFIQIKSGNLKNELGSIDFTPSKFNGNLSNEASIELIIYDLNTQQISYHKNVFGTSGTSENTPNDVTFSKNAENLLVGCLKKIFSDLDKKSL